MKRATPGRMLGGSWGAAILALLLAALPARADDDALLAALRTELDAIRQEMGASTDPAQQSRLQERMVKAIDGTLAQLSDESRPIMTVLLKVVGPLQSSIAAYLSASEDFFRSEAALFGTIKDREQLATRSKRIDQLVAASISLRARLDDVEAATSRELRVVQMTPAKRMAVLTGLNQTALRPLVTQRKTRALEGEILARYQTVLALLDREWGRWHGDEQGAVIWDAPSSEAATRFLQLETELQSLGESHAIALLEQSQ